MHDDFICMYEYDNDYLYKEILLSYFFRIPTLCALSLRPTIRVVNLVNFRVIKCLFWCVQFALSSDFQYFKYIHYEHTCTQ